MPVTEPIIRAENLGKKYLIEGRKDRPRYRALRDVLAESAKSVGRWFRPRQQRPRGQEEFWALKDVSFDIKEGEIVGIIGRNGAGKSTLLKVLGRITEPSAGRVTLHGRSASLLEVGTGFHPELTGRENIYLNGSILGMRRQEIDRKFDEIVAFAELDKFLDTPVKRYSSGMYTRLAFAIAAHLEPEILIIDEVLAVGDARFQKKCLGKMGQVARGGRTVLFVSHQMNAVEELCGRAMQLEQGRVVRDSTDVRAVVTGYLTDSPEGASVCAWENPGHALANPWFRPLRFFVGDERGRPLRPPVRNDAGMYVYVEGEVEQVDPALNCGYAIYAASGELLYWSLTTDGPEEQWPASARGKWTVRSPLPARFFNEGDYRLELIVALFGREYICHPGQNAPAVTLQIRGGLSDSPYWLWKRPGLLGPQLAWTRCESPAPRSTEA
jgi:lipopolysaccharide transport system ATP-binding protein